MRISDWSSDVCSSDLLEARQDSLQWQRDQADVGGGAEQALLDAQRATCALDAKARREDLYALELRAPNDGVLMLAANWSGVKPATGASLYAGREFGSLPDAGAMEVELSLPQLESQGVRVGQAVEMFPLGRPRSEEHTSELQSLMRISYAVF